MPSSRRFNKLWPWSPCLRRICSWCCSAGRPAPCPSRSSTEELPHPACDEDHPWVGAKLMVRGLFYSPIGLRYGDRLSCFYWLPRSSPGNARASTCTTTWASWSRRGGFEDGRDPWRALRPLHCQHWWLRWPLLRPSSLSWSSHLGLRSECRSLLRPFCSALTQPGASSKCEQLLLKTKPSSSLLCGSNVVRPALTKSSLQVGFLRLPSNLKLPWCNIYCDEVFVCKTVPPPLWVMKN